MKTVLREVVRQSLDVVFPRCCVHCADAVDGTDFRHVCRSCVPKIHLVAAPHCTTCGHPFFGVMEENRCCPHCETLVPEFGEGKTAVLLKGPGRALVHTLKYHQGLHVLEDMAELMRRAPGFAEFLRDGVLVPVPLHARKLRERGYNQSLLLAQACAQAVSPGARVEELLVRRIDTLSQTHFDRATRQENLKNAFALAPRAVINPGLRYLLIDDVFTTGSTLNACASVLRKAGALSLDVVTFGHG